jgi:hypothetical protein
MKVFRNITFREVWPDGTAAIIVAQTANDAAILINDFLEQTGLRGDVKPEHMQEIDATRAAVHIYCQGNAE